MVELYIGRDLHSDQLVLLRIASPNLSPQETSTLRGQFQREGAFLSQVRHPSIARHVAVDDTINKQPFTATELIEGITLQNQLAVIESECHATPAAD